MSQETLILETTPAVPSLIRLHIDLPFSQAQHLDQLALDAGGLTHKELLNNALTLFSWAVKEAKNGRTLASLKGNKYKELSMPVLDALKP